MADRERNHPAGCGYGLLGLCCGSCLDGPCRRSPFDDDTDAALCGADRDWIVANNVRERVLLEGLQAAAAFRDSLERASIPEIGTEASRREEMNDLLAPCSRDGNGLLEALYPEAAFPTLHAMGFSKASWMAELLDTATGRPPARREPEAILADALRLSAFVLVAEALSRELATTADEEDFALPEAPSPLLAIVSDDTGGADAERESLLTGIATTCAQTARIYRLPAAALPGFARAVFAKWGIPLSMTKSTAVVASSSLIRGLGALALGFSLAAIPGYPIGGSARVEGYLTDKMANTFGHAYLTIPPREDIGVAILRSLRP